MPARLGQLIDATTADDGPRSCDARRPSRSVAAPLLQVGPKRTTEDAEEAAETARALASRPVVADASAARRSARSSRPSLLAWSTSRRAPTASSSPSTASGSSVRSSPRSIPGASALRTPASRSTARRCGSTPSRPGLDVNPNAALASVTAAAYSERRIARLALRETRADLTTREAEKLGIRQRISTFTTEMGPSSSNRIHNIHLMAEYIDGTLIRPGETFSFNDSVGPRTVERGFLEGQMIIGSLLLPSIGGGVCQTATTLFNNAFELGLPILARHNHSFYISHYPMGRDATVSWGGPDFAFRNDLKTGILIKTSYTDSTLTFSFYGTDPKRRIVSSTGPQVNWRTPQTTYALDPYAPSGSVRTVARLEPVRLRRHRHAEDLRARQAAAQRLVHERVRRGRPDPDLRPRPLDPRPVLRPAARRAKNSLSSLLRVGLLAARAGELAEARRRSSRRSSRTASAGSSVTWSRSTSSGEIIPSASASLAHPVEQLAPVVRADEDDGEVEHLAGLDQRQRLEELVERAEAAGEDHEALGRLHEHRLARVEVLERHARCRSTGSAPARAGARC